jgi:hypothetical protein
MISQGSTTTFVPTDGIVNFQMDLESPIYNNLISSHFAKYGYKRQLIANNYVNLWKNEKLLNLLWWKPGTLLYYI